jgi:hypothetical protein
MSEKERQRGVDGETDEKEHVRERNAHLAPLFRAHYAWAHHTILLGFNQMLADSAGW